MKRTRRLILAAAALLAAVVQFSCEGSMGPGIHLVSDGSGEKKPIKLSLKKGETYNIETESDGEYTAGAGSGTITTREKNGLTMAFYVADVNESGTMSIDVRYTWLSYKAQGPGGEVAFDSNSPPEQMHPAVAGLKALVGKGFRLDVGSDGRVLDVQGIDKMLDRIIAELEVPGGGRKGSSEEAMKESMKEEFKDKNIEGRMKNMFGEYPGVPVGVGACWTAAGPGFYPPCRIEAKYTLNSRAEGVATIQVNAAIKPDETMAAGGYTYDVTGHMSGIIEVEEATGLPVSGALMIEASGTRTGTMVGSAPTPFSLKGNMTVRKK